MTKKQSPFSSSPLVTPISVVLLVIGAVAFGMYLKSFLQSLDFGMVSDEGQPRPVMQVEKASVVFDSEQEETEETRKDTKECAKYGIDSYDGYLPTYTVKSGDTLMSIARSELSAARVQELVELNKARYPILEESSPHLEAGWIFYLPPEQTISTNGRLIVTHGNISKSDVGWGISAPNRGTGPFDLKYLDQFFGDREAIDSGECVTVIYQAKVDYSEPLIVHEVRYQD